MDILIRDAREKRERLLSDIEVLEKEIQDTNLKEVIEKNYNILKDVLQKHQEYIKEKKMCKLRRNANDYVTGRVFKYAHKFDNMNMVRQDNRAPLPTGSTQSNLTASDTDMSSCLSITSDEANSSLREHKTITNTKYTFLLEMERFRRGQKHNKMAQATFLREPEGGREKVSEPAANKTGVTTRSGGRNMKPHNQ
ncbi:hypothetical protein NDU88_006777 [Pleurodeles waltl]|uniref:Uncharacterized protein n=1 Tax=Pleurodeles waltl TaxID=8319 RepID=A0AAV7PRM5_PLEWA|nr:hypothetical protein NDU88_006777 [Pleurodeles waltl]